MFEPDPNPFMYNECPFSVTDIETAIFLCRFINVKFILLPLDCDPFLYGYGQFCFEAS